MFGDCTVNLANIEPGQRCENCEIVLFEQTIVPVDGGGKNGLGIQLVVGSQFAGGCDGLLKGRECCGRYVSVAAAVG